jgi:hypothetical protein
LDEKNDIAAITPKGKTKNSTKSNNAGASSQAIGVGREEADAMCFVSWPKAMLRSTPKDSGLWPC